MYNWSLKRFAWKLSNDTNVDKIFCLPGNGGTFEIATNVDIDVNNFNAIYEYIKSENMDFAKSGVE